MMDMSFPPGHIGQTHITDQDVRNLTQETTNIGGASPQKPNSFEKMEPHLIEEIIKQAGQPLTGEGQLLERPEEQQKYVILFENGTMLVARTHLQDPYVLKVESLAELHGIKVTRRLQVDLETIQKAYNLTTSGIVRTQMTDPTVMQREILRMIGQAVDANASDIHIVVEPTFCVVEMRLNGVLTRFSEMPPEQGHLFCAACFAMADASDSNYNPYEYQAARISRTSADLPDRLQALRLQFNPLAYGGRYAIIRLLYRNLDDEDGGDVQGLGYHPKQYHLIRKMTVTPVGIGIISGPTGSGKSTTLFHALKTTMFENGKETNVVTIEDPPEYVISGAKQMPVTNATSPEERSRKFIQAIAAALRSDPDTIMIGEVRDRESAKLAVEAAMTGHQVWTTVHANNAMIITNRLRDIGVEEFNLYTPGLIFGLIGQRLARVLCQHCKISAIEASKAGKFTEGQWERLSRTVGDRIDQVFMPGPGCEACNYKAFTGRSVVAEVMAPDETLMDFFRQEQLAQARKYWIEEMGGMTMMQHGLDKVFKGEVSPLEIERVIGMLGEDTY